ncbi:acyltransferase [Leifsonia sp. Le1]|uniref:acyltransferase n=1 Tax=Leifsonia sp. Le1 TaxID=3404918 RepID=UPI003EBBAF14
MIPLRVKLSLAPLVRRFGLPTYQRYMGAVLRASGATVANAQWLSSRAYYDPGPDVLLDIEDGVVVSNDVRLLTHDYSLANVARELGHIGEGESLHYRRRIRLERNSFIGMAATILPGVTVGAGSIVGAGSVVTRDVPPRSIVAGNPARVIADADDYYQRRRADQVHERREKND